MKHEWLIAWCGCISAPSRVIPCHRHGSVPHCYFSPHGQHEGRPCIYCRSKTWKGQIDEELLLELDEIETKLENQTKEDLGMGEWMSEVPKTCDLCRAPITTTFVDGRTLAGYWANMCPQCHARAGVGLGVGRGQKYDAQTRKKIAG